MINEEKKKEIEELYLMVDIMEDDGKKYGDCIPMNVFDTVDTGILTFLKTDTQMWYEYSNKMGSGDYSFYHPKWNKKIFMAFIAAGTWSKDFTKFDLPHRKDVYHLLEVADPVFEFHNVDREGTNIIHTWLKFNDTGSIIGFRISIDHDKAA